MTLDFGNAVPPRRLMRWEDLGRRSMPRLAVVIERTGRPRRPHLVVRDKQRLPSWTRERLPGLFDFSQRTWRAAALVLACAGNNDTRGLEEDVIFADGNPLNLKVDNLRLPKIAPPARRLDELEALAYVPALSGLAPAPHGGKSWSLMIAHFDVATSLLTELLGRFSAVHLSTTVVQATQRLSDGTFGAEGERPLYAAHALVEGEDADGWVECQIGTAHGDTPAEAAFFAEFDTLRKLAFYGRNVAYCGELGRWADGQVVVALEPFRIGSAHYRLIVEVARGADMWFPPALREGRLALARYELDVRIEQEKVGARTTYAYVGGIPLDIKRGFEAVIDFTKRPIRLHNLVMALLWNPIHHMDRKLYDVASRFTALPPYDPNRHCHHVHGNGLDNRSALLRQLQGNVHREKHFRWTEILGASESKVVRGIERRAALPMAKVISPSDFTMRARTVHTLIEANWNPKKPAQSTSSSSPTTVATSASNGRRIDARQRVARILNTLAVTGPITATHLFSLTSLPRSSGYRWLKELASEGKIGIDKLPGVKDALVYLGPNVMGPVTRPRRRGKKVR